MDLFGGEAPKLPDYSITRRGQAVGVEDAGGEKTRGSLRGGWTEGARGGSSCKTDVARRRRCTEQSADSVAPATVRAGAVPLLRVAICGNIANDEVAPVMGPQGPHRCNV